VTGEGENLENNKEKQIRRILKWAIDKTSVDNTKDELEKGKTFAPKSGQSEEKNIIEDAKLKIDISKNEMGATVFLIPPKGGKMLTIENIKEELVTKGVEYGIDDNKIKEIVAMQIFNTSVHVASGLLPVNGENGRIEYHFDTNRDLKPRMLEDGTADYHNLGLVINVKKGDLLAEIIPPTMGIPGKTVTGKTIPAKDGKEARVRIGKNVIASEDGYKMYAEIDGQPIIYDKKLSVLPILEIKGDVGPATGNINFLGSVIVQGNVKSGFTINANGDLQVNGIVEAAEIVAEGDVIINRGIQGQGKGIIKAGRDFKVRYIENATVEAGENINIAEASMHSCLLAGKNIKLDGKKGLIVGGTAKAGEKLVAKTIGSPMSTYTEIEVGINPTLKINYQNIYNKLKEIEKDLPKIDQALGVLERLKEKDLLTHDKQILFDKLTLTKSSLKEQQSELIEEKEKLDFMISHSSRASISASNVCYSGVNIIIGNASLKVRDKINHVTFYNYEGQIKFGPYEG
jgi:uncharacterized protein (DUF342 family)